MLLLYTIQQKREMHNILIANYFFKKKICNLMIIQIIVMCLHMEII